MTHFRVPTLKLNLEQSWNKIFDIIKSRPHDYSIFDLKIITSCAKSIRRETHPYIKLVVMSSNWLIHKLLCSSILLTKIRLSYMRETRSAKDAWLRVLLISKRNRARHQGNTTENAADNRARITSIRHQIPISAWFHYESDQTNDDHCAHPEHAWGIRNIYQHEHNCHSHLHRSFEARRRHMVMQWSTQKPRWTLGS